MCGRDSSRNDEPTEYVASVGRISEWNINCHTMQVSFLLPHIVSIPTMTTGGPLTWAFKDERDSVPIVSSSEGNSVIIASTLEDLVHALKDRKEGRGDT